MLESLVWHKMYSLGCEYLSSPGCLIHVDIDRTIFGASRMSQVPVSLVQEKVVEASILYRLCNSMRPISSLLVPVPFAPIALV